MTKQFYKCGHFFQYDRIGASSSPWIRLRETLENKLVIILKESVICNATRYVRIHNDILTNNLHFCYQHTIKHALQIVCENTKGRGEVTTVADNAPILVPE